MSGKQDSGQPSKNSTSSTPTPRSPTVTTVAPTTRPTTSAGISQSSKATIVPTVDNTGPLAVGPTETALLAPGATQVEIVGVGPTTLDAEFNTLGVIIAGTQPNFPTVWPPPPPLPTVQLPAAGRIPWRQWVENMAVRPYPTDPPPGPSVVSRYPGLTTN
jgi:hypothetical protein